LCGGDWEAIKSSICERLAPYAIFCPFVVLDVFIIPHLLPRAAALECGCERLPGFFPMLRRSQHRRVK
jgi:hypothetical protein